MEWTHCRVSDLAEIISGGTPKTSIESYWNGNIPWLSVKDFSGDSKYVSSTEKTITEEGLSHSAANLLDVNDIVISARGTVGELAMLSVPMSLNQSCFGLRPKCDADYLYYLLKIKVAELKQRANGGVFGTIIRTTFDSIKCTLPLELKDQHRIASILSTYDTFIENNTKRIRLLEKMAENLYKEWFSYGKIIKGGTIVRLTDIIQITRGLSYSTAEIDCEEGLDLINLKNIQAYGGFRYDGTKKFCGKYKNEQIVCEGDLVMGVTDMTQDRRTVGSVALIPKTDKLSVISADLIKISSSISSVFLFGMFKYGNVSKYVAQFANGANVLHLRPKALHNIKVLLPNPNLINKYVDIVSPMVAEMNKLYVLSEKLARQRDLLLPRLMSGKLEVKEELLE